MYWWLVGLFSSLHAVFIGYLLVAKLPSNNAGVPFVSGNDADRLRTPRRKLADM